MTKNDGGPAFPRRASGDGGMTFRDWFAGQALAGWLASFSPDDCDPAPERLAGFVYDLADAMIAERER